MNKKELTALNLTLLGNNLYDKRYRITSFLILAVIWHIIGVIKFLILWYAISCIICDIDDLLRLIKFID